MLYILNNNVYLVRGKVRSCIYDFNSLKLYSINDALARVIETANVKGISVDSVEGELKSLFAEFIKDNIFTLSDTASPHDIQELKTPDYGCSFAWVEITKRCNLRCLHCYNESDIHCDTIMSLDNYKRVIDNLIEMGIRRVQLIGGEPLFEKELLKEMLAYTVGKFSFIEIFTNGTLLSDEWFGFLAAYNIHVALSVYSYDEKQHDSVTCVRGSWARTNESINKLKTHNIPYRVCNVLMDRVSLGAKNTTLYELSTEKDVVRMSGRADFHILSDELIKKKLITKDKFRVPLKKGFSALLLSGHNCFKKKIYISADMKIFPCVMERRLMHCEISNGKGITLDESICNLSKDRIKECCNCEYRYSCHDCRPDSLSGDIFEKPWYCTYNPLTGEWANVDAFIIKLRQLWDN